MLLFDRLKNDIPEEWDAYINHPFVCGLGDGTLPEACFQHYLVQDYLFLVQFARAYALAVYKAHSIQQMRGGLDGLKAILDVELQLHLKLCDTWGLSAEEVENTTEASATIAYSRYVLEAGQAGDLLDLFVALAPCMIGYVEIGTKLDQKTKNDVTTNSYRVWIEEYASEAYQKLAHGAKTQLDLLAEESLTEARYPRLLRLFRQATRLETEFWQMGMQLKC